MSERLRGTLRKYYGDVEIELVAGGHTLAERGLAVLPDLGRCFVKAGYDERTRTALATEAAVLSQVDSRHLPRLIRHERGLLVTEDLSGAHWPPPWDRDTGLIWDALDALAGSEPPDVADQLEHDPTSWDELESSSGRLGSPLTDWLATHLEALNESALSVSPAGSDFVHADLSFENLCVAQRGVVVIDWEFAAIGNRELDIATVGLDLVAEGVDGVAIPLENPIAWAARLATWLIAGVTAGSEWAIDVEKLRSERLRLAEAALRWWAEGRGVSRPPEARASRRTG